MKSFTNEEIIGSLKDNLLGGIITSCLFMDDIEQIKSDLENRKRLELAGQIKSKLLPRAIEDLTKKDIFDTDGGLTVLGLAHVTLFIKMRDKVNASAETSDKNEADSEEKNNTDEIKALVALSLSKFSIDEIVELYNTRKHKVLTYYLIKELNNQGISKILEHNLISKDNFITEKGWFAIKWYIDVTKNLEPAKSETEERTASKKKWWEFWN